jgi:hypothetical protein
VDLAVDRRELVLNGDRRGDLPGGHALVGVVRDGGGADGLALFPCHLEGLAVTDRQIPGAAMVARDHVSDGERMSARPLGVDEIRQGAVQDVRVQRSARLDDVRHRKLAC